MTTTEHVVSTITVGEHHHLGYCQTHDISGLYSGSTPDKARRAFVCDPTRRRFIYTLGSPTDPGEPTMTDIGGLTEVVRSAVEYYYLAGGGDELTIWRWTGETDQPLERLTFRCVDPGEFVDDYACPIWAVFGPDGTEHLSTSVMLDGRA